MAAMQCLLYLVVFVVLGNEAILSSTSGTSRVQSEVYKNNGIDKRSKEESLQAQPSERGSVYGHPYAGGSYGDGYDVHSSYAYGYHDHHHPVPYPPPHYDPSYAIKSLLVPLAGVALLGAAAVFASNPVLLQLGVVSGKRRRRRDTENDDLLEKKLKDVTVLEKFMHQLPKESLKRQEKQILANYLSCTGLTNSSGSSACLERLFCEIQRPDANVTDLERNVLKIIMSEIYENEYVDNSIKKNMLLARNVGRAGQDCDQFLCDQPNLQKL